MISEKTNFNILIVDNDEDVFFNTNQYLQNIKGYNFNVERCCDYESAMNDLCEKKYDLYLVAYHLGAKTGLDFIKEAFEKECDAPVIILNCRAELKLDAAIIHAAPVDYFIKGEMDTEKLERCIRKVIEKSVNEQTLKLNERKFRYIFERSKDAVFLIDINTMLFTDVNEATLKLFKYEAKEMKSKSIFDLILLENEKIQIKNLLKKGVVDDKEVQMQSKNKDIIYCSLSLSQEKDSTGNFFFRELFMISPK